MRLKLIHFKNEEGTTRSFPLSHLLSMELQNESISMLFSTDRITLSGTGLEELWNNLLINPERSLDCGPIPETKATITSISWNDDKPQITRDGDEVT